MKRIFVAGYNPKEYGSPEIERRFRKFGDINKIQMKTGYCFVTYEEPGSATTAMDEMHNNYLGGAKIVVNPAYYKEGYQADYNKNTKPIKSDRNTAAVLNTKRLFVVNYPSYFNESDLHNLFGKYGKIIDLVIINSFGFVEFEKMSCAQEAYDALNGEVIKGNKMVITSAHAKQSTDPTDRLADQKKRRNSDQGQREIEDNNYRRRNNDDSCSRSSSRNKKRRRNDSYSESPRRNQKDRSRNRDSHNNDKRRGSPQDSKIVLNQLNDKLDQRKKVNQSFNSNNKDEERSKDLDKDDTCFRSKGKTDKTKSDGDRKDSERQLSVRDSDVHKKETRDRDGYKHKEPRRDDEEREDKQKVSKEKRDSSDDNKSMSKSNRERWI